MPRVKPFNPSFVANLKAKKTFLLSMYATLIIQLIVSFGVMNYLLKNQKLGDKLAKLWILWILIEFGILFTILLAPLPMFAKVLLFTTFSILMGISLYITAKRFPVQTVKAVLIGAIGVFIAMSILAFILSALGLNLSFLFPILFAILIGVIIAGIVMLFVDVGNQTKKIFYTIILALFSVFTVVDTNMILQNPLVTDFIVAAVEFYLNFINIFSSMLGLEGLS